MPILEQPDASTTIEEVKRRLIEETDGSYDNPISNFVDLNVGTTSSSVAGPILPTAAGIPLAAVVSSAPSVIVNQSVSSVELPVVTAHDSSSSGSDSSTETAATFTGTGSNNASNNTTSSPPKPQQVVPTEIPMVSSTVDGTTTTVLYYMPNELMPYKVQLPHCPLHPGSV